MPNKNEQAPLLKVIAAFAIIYIVWGSTYFFIQAAEVSFPPFMLGALRFTIAGIIMLVWCALRKEKLFHPPILKTAFIAGNILLFAGTGSVIWAEQLLPSSFVAVVVSVTPVWIVLFDRRNLKRNLSNYKIIIGVIMGVIGVALLLGEKVLENLKAPHNGQLIISLLVIVAGNICWAYGSLYSKYYTTGNASVNAAWQMAAAGLTFIIIAFLNGEVSHFNWGNVQTKAWSSLIYLVVMGSLLGYSAYIWLLDVRPATQVSTNSYVNPVVAVLLGALFAHEKITSIQIYALAIILLSVFIINIDKYKKVLH
ncbi:MAG: EamA family transporter [Bacteroidetes bacterium]|nr:EamA family transporter [Bacteroidota bacterium]